MAESSYVSLGNRKRNPNLFDLNLKIFALALHYRIRAGAKNIGKAKGSDYRSIAGKLSQGYLEINGNSTIEAARCERVMIEGRNQVPSDLKD